ncbi:hypothetical protein ACB268_15005, partial [Aeromonas sanarellii]
RNGFAHDVMVPSWRDQARGNSGSRDDRLTFSCQCHLGEQLHCTYYICKKMDFSVERAVIALIDSVLQQTGLSKHQCTLLGASKGGSAALYYGLKYDFKNIVASCPQFYIGSYSKKDWPQSAKNILDEQDPASTSKLDALIPQLLELDKSTDRNIYLITSPDDIQYATEVEPNLPYFSKYSNFNLIVTRSAIAWQHNNITRYNVPIILSIILAHGEGIAPRFGMVNNGVPLSAGPVNKNLIDGSAVAAINRCTIKQESLHMEGVAFLRGLSFENGSRMRRSLVLVSNTQHFQSELRSLVNRDINYDYYLTEHIDYRAAGFTFTDSNGFDPRVLPDGIYTLHIDMITHETRREALTSKPFDIRGLVGNSDVRLVGSETGVMLYKQPLISPHSPTYFTIEKTWQRDSKLHYEGAFAVHGIEVADWGTIRYYLILTSNERQFVFELGNAHREKLNQEIGKGMGIYQKAYYATPKFEGVSLDNIPSGTYKVAISMAHQGSLFTQHIDEEIAIG